MKVYWGYLNLISEIKGVIFEIFTKNIIFVLTKYAVTELNKIEVDSFLKNFDWSDEYDSYNTSSILKNGIKNKSLKIEYLTRVLNLKNSEQNGVVYAATLGLNLYFNNGFLVDFQSPDDLNEWAMHWKQINPEFFSTYETVAKLYWGNNTSKISNEINIQATAWAGTPKGLTNKFIELHRTKFGTVNFHMLLVCHCGQKITLSQFLEINHGRYEDISQNFSYRNDLKKYRLGLFTYEFLEDGTLNNFYTTSK